MNQLAEGKCISYPKGSPCLSRPEVTQLLTALQADWQVSADGRSLTRRFTFQDYYRTIAFVNVLAYIANVEDHHPELIVGYDFCRVTFETHTVNGLSRNDFICAAKLDRLVN
jgi:4a-hydroxytetrahydrobiopterin dehydratase